MKAVILAGGLRTRLLRETTIGPKPMVNIGGRPMLWHIMKTYQQHGVSDFVVCLGHPRASSLFMYLPRYCIGTERRSAGHGSNRIINWRRFRQVQRLPTCGINSCTPLRNLQEFRFAFLRA